MPDPTFTPCRDGDTMTGPDGVKFTYHAKVPALVASTSGHGFRWRWVLAGKIAVPDGEQTSVFDGSAIVGTSSSAIHALLTRGDNTTAIYATGPRDHVQIERVGSSGLFTKRPRSLVVDLPGGAMVGTTEVGEFTESASRMQFKKEGDFADAFA